MLTYTQDFSPYGLGAATERHSEGKAAARRRRQMERQAERMAPRLAQEAEQRALAIEQAQDERMAQVIELALAPPKPKATTQSQLVEWFEKWRKPIRSWFRGRLSVPPGDIDDLAQEVFMRLLRYPDAAVENPQGYLFRIAANVASEWRDRSRFKKPHDSEWLDNLVLDSEEQPEEVFERVQWSDHVEAMVNELPPRQRMVLLKHVNEEMTYKKIAEECGLTYRIVLRDLTKAYSTLRRTLQWTK